MTCDKYSNNYYSYPSQPKKNFKNVDTNMRSVKIYLDIPDVSFS